MKRGEIRWYKFKPPDKNRPVLILTWTSVIDYLGQVTVAPITSTVRGIPSEVSLARQDGMSRDCAINLDHVQTVSKGKIGRLVTELTPGKLIEVQRAISFALDL